MPRYLSRCLALVLALLSLNVAADENPNFFRNLPWVFGPLTTFENNNVYAIGSKLNVMWETNFSSMSLVLWQEGNQNYDILVDRRPVFNKSLMWDVNLDGKFNASSSTLASPNVFMFELWEMIGPGDQIGGRFSCHRFNITDSRANTISASSTSKETSPNGLSSDAKVGIGVGVGVGAASLIASAMLSWIFWRRSKTIANTPDQVDPRPDTNVAKSEPQYYKDQATAKSRFQTRELSGETQTHELFSTQRSHELPGME